MGMLPQNLLRSLRELRSAAFSHQLRQAYWRKPAEARSAKAGARGQT